MNRWRPPLGQAVYPPLSSPWLPVPPSPVDEATLRRVIAGLERLIAQDRHAAARR